MRRLAFTRVTPSPPPPATFRCRLLAGGRIVAPCISACNPFLPRSAASRSCAVLFLRISAAAWRYSPSLSEQQPAWEMPAGRSMGIARAARQNQNTPQKPASRAERKGRRGADETEGEDRPLRQRENRFGRPMPRRAVARGAKSLLSRHSALDVVEWGVRV